MTDSTISITSEDDEDLGDLLLEVLPGDGTTIGNLSAREALSRIAERQISEEVFEAVKEKALALGMIRKGRGGAIKMTNVNREDERIRQLSKKRYVNNSNWRTQLDTPCCLLMPCNACGQLYTPLEFYQTKNKSRTDFLGLGRVTKCKTCSARSYKSLSQESKLYQFAKKRAKQKSIEFSIKKSDIYIPSNCPILGIQMEAGSGSGGTASSENDGAPTIDRIENLIGYTPQNISIISRRANTLKKDAELVELIAILVYMIRHSSHQKDTFLPLSAKEDSLATKILELKA